MKKNNETDVMYVTNSDLWNLDQNLAKLIYPRLNAFYKSCDAHPTGLTMKEWKRLLKEMAKSFKWYSKHAYEVGAENEEKYKEFQDVTLPNFVKYYTHLWW